MKAVSTQVAASIFNSIQRRRATAVFLCMGTEGPRLSFGVNQTDHLTYRICIRASSLTLSLSSEEPEPFALLLDDLGEQGSLRLVLYLPDNPQPRVEWNGRDGDPPAGQILIQARAQNGLDRAVLHAVFAPNGQSSLIIDSSPKLIKHLDIASMFLRGGTKNV